jgi:hypothetical protein
MSIVCDKHYVGFEGEPEVHFLYQRADMECELTIWEGYFDEIMTSIEPEEYGWTGLAYYYHMCLGWTDELAWKVEDLNGALVQLESIDRLSLSGEASQVLEDISTIFAQAIEHMSDIYILRN